MVGLPNIYQIADLPIERMDDIYYLQYLLNEIQKLYGNPTTNDELSKCVFCTRQRIYDRIDVLEDIDTSTHYSF